MPDTSFAARLDLILKALSMSRARLAADLGVDKSLVSRWASGAIVPSAHNLAHLTQYLAGRAPGFTLLDWERDLEAIANRFGVAPPAPPPPAEGRMSLPLSAGLLAAARPRQAAYEGIWRSTRLSAAAGPQAAFVHDHVIMRGTPEGVLKFRLGVFHMRFEGSAVLSANQLFVVANEPGGEFLFAIFNGLPTAKVSRSDGVMLTRLPGSGGAVVANACLMERVADLTGDAAADEARLEAMLSQNPLAAEGSISQAVRDHLFRDVGPAAMLAGGEPLLQMNFARSMALGSDV